MNVLFAENANIYTLNVLTNVTMNVTLIKCRSANIYAC